MEKAIEKKNSIGKLTAKILFIVLGALLVFYSLIILGMIFWGLLTSLKSEADYLGGLGYFGNSNVLGLPRLDKDIVGNSSEYFFQFKNYSIIMSKLQISKTVTYYPTGAAEKISYTVVNDFPMMLANTLMYTLGGALIYALMPALTAYLCAKYDYRLSRALVVVYTLMMCMPIVGSLPTELTFLRDTGLYDSILGNYIQKMTGSGMYFFVYLAYCKGMSNTYREAAVLDGAGPFKVMVQIYFPLAIKMISTVFLIQFVNLWNDYQTPLIYLPTWPTLAYGVFYVSTPTQSFDRDLYSIPTQISAPMMLAIPIIIIFVIFKDKLMGNISLGGIKE